MRNFVSQTHKQLGDDATPEANPFFRTSKHHRPSIDPFVFFNSDSLSLQKMINDLSLLFCDSEST